MDLCNIFARGRNFAKIKPRRGAGTGRQGGLKIRCPKRTCGFNSHPRHIKILGAEGAYKFLSYRWRGQESPCFLRATSPTRGTNRSPFMGLLGLGWVARARIPLFPSGNFSHPRHKPKPLYGAFRFGLGGEGKDPLVSFGQLLPPAAH